MNRPDSTFLNQRLDAIAEGLKEGVRREVQRDHAERRMVLRDFGEEGTENRTGDTHQRVDDAGFLGDLEHAQEQGEDADQAEGDFRGGLGEIEGGGGNRVRGVLCL